MKNNRLIAILPFISLLFTAVSKPILKDELPKVGTFEVVNNTNCTLSDNSISTSSGSFLLRDASNINENFELSFNLNISSTSSSNFGIVIYGTESNGKLSGNIFRPYFSGSSWQMVYGTLKDDVFSQISNTTCDFGSHFQGNYSFYVSRGVMTLRMDDWCISTYDLYFTEGNTYIYSNGINTTVNSPLVKSLEYELGNYMYRDQWGGMNIHGFTTCFNTNATHSFKMRIPAAVDLSTITKLYLVRGSVQRNYGQKANVKINGASAADWENMDQTNKLNGTIDTYSDATYAIPLSYLNEDRLLSFEIKNIDGEYVMRGYKLVYETAEGRFLADKIISGSALSYEEHEFTYSALGWTGSQYLFLDLATNQNGHNRYFVGTKPLAKVTIIHNFSYWKAENINITFTNPVPIEVNFKDYVFASDGFSWRNELWFNSTKMADGTVYTLTNVNRDVKYTVDFYIDGLDISGSRTKKVSPYAQLHVVGYESGDAGEIINVETDINGLTKNGFVKLFNSRASRNFELGSSKVGATITYEFTGTYICLFGYKGPVGGTFKATVDNVDKGTFDTHADADAYQVNIGNVTGLEDGRHTIVITCLEEKWVAIDYFQFEISKEAYYSRFNLAQVGDIICSNPTPAGGGNKDLNVIRDEKVAPIGANGLGPTQYDSFDGSGVTENVFYMGYSFAEDTKVGKVCYQAGCTWATGGWFKNGSLHLEALIGDEWVTVELLEDINYPNSNVQGDFIPNNIYIFKFNQITCKGIRIIGDAGGSEHFVSVSEIEVYQNINAKSYCEGATYREAIEF